MIALTDADVESLPRVKTLTSPPKSIEHQVTTRPISNRFQDNGKIFWGNSVSRQDKSKKHNSTKGIRNPNLFAI